MGYNQDNMRSECLSIGGGTATAQLYTRKKSKQAYAIRVVGYKSWARLSLELRHISGPRHTRLFRVLFPKVAVSLLRTMHVHGGRRRHEGMPASGLPSQVRSTWGPTYAACASLFIGLLFP